MTFPSNTRDTRPEGPHFATPRCDTCGGERLYACHVCGRCVERANREPIRDLKVPAPVVREPSGWPDPPESHEDFTDDAPAASDPVGGGY